MSPRPPAPLGTRAADHGDMRIKVGEHPRAAHGWAREHVLVMWDLLGAGPHTCGVCGREVDWDDGLEIDHVNRRRRDNRPENLRAVCRVCNNRNRVIPPRPLP